jgi:hypothetical protein
MLVPTVQLDRRGIPVFKGTRDRKGQLVSLVLRVLRVLPVRLVLLAPKAFPVRRVLQVRKELLVL